MYICVYFSKEIISTRLDEDNALISDNGKDVKSKEGTNAHTKTCDDDDVG